MGHSELIPLIIRKSKTGQYIAPWNIEPGPNTYGLGHPTTKRLSDWRDKFNNSLLKGGCNAHVGISAWLQCKIEVYNQKTGEILATHNPPLFELIP